jgi:uncharacterized protein (TIGR02118 family)
MTRSMFKVVTLLKRQREMTPQRFQSEWRDSRGPRIVRQQQVRRYVQSHPLPLAYRHGEPACDGLEELWFDNEASALEYYGTTTNSDREEDERFLGNGTLTMAVEEIRLTNGSPSPGSIKNVILTNRKVGMSRQAFFDYWQRMHPLVAGRLPGMRRYEQNHVRESQWTSDRYDGLSLVWFDSMEAVIAVTQTPEFALTMKDELNFLEHAGHLPIVLTREYVLVDR